MSTQPLKKTPSTGVVYQLKITLRGSTPPIWRRIQVEDCTLDKLHEHIQTSMGWSNSHLHQFKIGEQVYGDSMLMEEDFEERPFTAHYHDSTTTRLSHFLSRVGVQFRFGYEYDFGDSWEHDVVFEDCPNAESGKYPLCLAGERACPPEDIDGIPGYERCLRIVADTEHQERNDTLRWAGGKFDSEAFDPAAATKAMKMGLPDWRNEERV
jgi:hypothetical protein